MQRTKIASYLQSNRLQENGNTLSTKPALSSTVRGTKDINLLNFLHSKQEVTECLCRIVQRSNKCNV